MNPVRVRVAVLSLAVLLPAGVPLAGEAPEPAPAPPLDARVAALESKIDTLSLDLDRVRKAVDDVLWYQRVGDVAEIDKVTIVGPPNPRGEETYGIANARHPLKIYAYVFTPRKAPEGRRPLLILPHGGVHGDFTTYHAHIVRELMDRGYVVVAPEFRGSTGYGREFKEAIDYGGLEVDDCVAARDWAVENLAAVDGRRVGIVGWSHGGMIALLAGFDHPDKFQAIYAGVPVSDLLARMGYATDEYRALFSAPYHLGKTAGEAVETYKLRSPAWHAAKLKVPLLVHTTTNDRDVSVVEVEHLIQALKAEDKNFEYKVYEDAPGGHSFNRIDTREARASRAEVYAFLAKHLKP